MGRSYCPKCQKQIAWYDNVPIFSYIFLLGRCRHCRQRISIQYPLVELVAGCLFLFSFLVHGDSLLMVARDCFIISVMIIVFIYDLRWFLILDKVTLPASLLVFLFNLYLGMSWQNLLISGIIGGSFFLLQFLVSKGKWIGGGDVRLGLLMGLALGWPGILVALLMAYIIGSIVGVFLLLLKKKKWNSEVPLGIFLSAATVATLFFGDYIINWYLSLLI